MSDRRCPEGVIVDGVVIQCDHDGGHLGVHTAQVPRGQYEWPNTLSPLYAPSATSGTAAHVPATPNAHKAV